VSRPPVVRPRRVVAHRRRSFNISERPPMQQVVDAIEVEGECYKSAITIWDLKDVDVATPEDVVEVLPKVVPKKLTKAEEMELNRTSIATLIECINGDGDMNDAINACDILLSVSAKDRIQLCRYKMSKLTLQTHTHKQSYRQHD
jgi:hypothetical protein